jgi:hypothetical protein
VCIVRERWLHSTGVPSMRRPSRLRRRSRSPNRGTALGAIRWGGACSCRLWKRHRPSPLPVPLWVVLDACRCQFPWLTTGSDCRAPRAAPRTPAAVRTRGSPRGPVRRASPGQPPDRRCARPRYRGAARARSRARGRQQTDGALVVRGAVPVVRLRHSIVTATHRHRGGRSRVGKTGGPAGRSGRAPRLTRQQTPPSRGGRDERPDWPDGHPDDAAAGRPYNCEGRTDGSSA